MKRLLVSLSALLLASIACDAHRHEGTPPPTVHVQPATIATGSERGDAGTTARDEDGASPESDGGALGVFDLHVDLGWAAHTKGARLDDPAREASMDRLVRGEVGTLVVPLYVSRAFAMTPAEARRAYQKTFDDAQAMFTRDANLRTTPLLAPPEPGKIRLRVSFEGADGFADDVAAAEDWVARGACLFGLVHSRTNALGGASQDPSRDERRRGLTAVGKNLAERIVAKGALLDVAHASDATADDLLAIAEARHAPVVDSHTGARALVPIDRNLDDARIARVARTGGIVSLSLHSGHVSSRRGERATLDDVTAHLEHLLKIAGEDHVAIGSDLEGDILMPTGVDGAAFWPELDRRLASRGLSRPTRAKVFRKNAERVFGWAEAHGCGAKTLAK